mmetsp:Transcript_50255/g.90295  ORF Transcript_50255/g.90295 Transcript_50255/m.90295 type:complete len:247 (-) Transcript_50255:52-792(-)
MGFICRRALLLALVAAVLTVGRAEFVEQEGGFYSMVRGFFTRLSGLSDSQQAGLHKEATGSDEDQGKLEADEEASKKLKAKADKEASKLKAQEAARLKAKSEEEASRLKAEHEAARQKAKAEEEEAARRLKAQEEAAAASSDSCSAAGGCAAGAVASCDVAAMQENVEPADTMVKHAEGSACCNPSPQPEPTDRLGCCQRCVDSAECEVHVFQPSTGTCWLLSWKGDLRTTTTATDRVMGKRVGLA